ncbi:unnamed protein product, partial [Closterium sp. NIES-53]
PLHRPPAPPPPFSSVPLLIVQQGGGGYGGGGGGERRVPARRAPCSRTHSSFPAPAPLPPLPPLPPLMGRGGEGVRGWWMCLSSSSSCRHASSSLTAASAAAGRGCEGVADVPQQQQLLPRLLPSHGCACCCGGEVPLAPPRECSSHPLVGAPRTPSPARHAHPAVLRAPRALQPCAPRAPCCPAALCAPRALLPCCPVRPARPAALRAPRALLPCCPVRPVRPAALCTRIRSPMHSPYPPPPFSSLSLLLVQQFGWEGRGGCKGEVVPTAPACLLSLTAAPAAVGGSVKWWGGSGDVVGG